MSAALLAMALLAGCASPTAHKPGVVLDAIQKELAIAAPKPGVTPAVEAALLPPLQFEQGNGAPGEARFDISVQNAPAEQVFMAIVGGTPYSMLVPQDVRGNVTLSLKNVTVREVLDTIRDIYGYDYRVQDKRIFIQANTPQTRVFQVNYLAARRIGATQMTLTSTAITNGGGGNQQVPNTAAAQNAQPRAAGAGGEAGGTGGTHVSTTLTHDFWRDLQQALAAMIGTADGRQVIVNPTSGVIVVRAMPAELRGVEQYLRATRLVVERQVMLEAKIIEVALNEGYQAGVNWADFGRLGEGSAGRTPNLGGIGMVGRDTVIGATGALLTPNAGVALASGASAIGTALNGGFYGVAFQSANFTAMLSFLETQGTLHVLSSPRVATLNNQKAVLKVGNDEFFVTNVTTTTTSGTGATTTSPTVTLQPFFSGISLDVTPQIDENSQIILHVHPSVSVVTEKSKTIDLGTGGSLILPLAASTVNESDSVVRVRDGHIVAIGGLMRHRQVGDRSGLPGSTPHEFTLFGQRERSLTKSELVILIKPTVIRDDDSWRADLVDTQNRLQEYAPPAPVNIVGG